MTTNYDTAFWKRLDESLGRERLEMADDAPKKSKLFTHLDDLTISKPNWLIDGLIEQETLCMCFGGAGSGKSFVAIDMALCIATGRDYHEHAVAEGTVFYIAGEGASGFARRTAVWQKANDVGKGQAKFYKSNRAVIMSDPASVTLLKAEMELLVAEAGAAPKLVIIDTLARSLGAASENDGKDVNMFIEQCDSIIDAYGCTVMLVHHTGHGSKERARGASQINAALDHEFRVEPWEDNKVLLTFTKQKEDAMPEPLGFIKRPIDIVLDDLSTVTSIVLDKVDGLPEKGEKLTPARRWILNELLDDDGTERDSVRDAFVEHERAEIDAKNAASDGDTKTFSRDNATRSFNRNLKALLEGGKVVETSRDNLQYLHKVLENKDKAND